MRDLYLPKQPAEILRPRLKNNNLLETDVSFAWYRHREKKLKLLFLEKKNFVFFDTVNDLLQFF